MNPIKIVTIPLLSFAIAACGGGGSPDNNTDTPDSGTGTDGGNTPVVTTPDTDGSTTVPVGNLRFGSGEGENFIPGKITLDQNYSMLAGSLQVSVNVVDNGSGNTLVPQSYLYTFNSTCSTEATPRASFNVTSLGSTTGTAATTYNNINCSGNDALTVKLFSADGKVELAEATATVTGYAPQLGSGSGSGYFDGKISGDSTLETESSSYLSASVVDVADSNALITDADKEKYTVVWRSSCADSAFSITSEKLETGNLDTRYDAKSCVGVDVVTLSIYATNDLTVPLDSISMNMQIGAVVDNTAVPVLSALTIADDHVLAGSSLAITVQGIDSNDNSALTGDYKYQFVTDCAAGTGAFPMEVVETSTGSVSTTFNNLNCVTNGETTLTVNLFEANADVVTDAPLSTLTTKFKTAYPKLGFGSGASFVAGKIDGNTNLIDEASTILTVNAVDGLNLNSLINSASYVAQWSAECAEATFSIDSQPLSTSNVVTRYDANTCTGTDTVTVKLFAKDDLSTPLDSATTSLTIGETASIGALPKLGTGNGSGFNAGQLDLSASYVLAGGSLVIGVNGVNELDANALLTLDYIYKFTSTCMAAGNATFSSDTITSATGQVTNTYFNQTCSGSDTVTVELFAAGANVTSDTPLHTASASFNTAIPQLGFGSGADFVVGTISGNTNLVDEASTKLSATVVDPLNVNRVLRSSDYYISWEDDCAYDYDAADANSTKPTFSIVTQNISSNIETRYDADAVNCKTPQVTLKLFNQFDEVLDSVNVDLSIAEGLEPSQPLLGTGEETTFVVQTIKLSETPIAARQTVGISVNIVDGKDGTNTLLDDAEYAVAFDSTCVADGRASFDVVQKRTTSGTVEVFYTASGCTGEDRINATLYAVENNVVLTDSSLAVATTVLVINSAVVNSIEYQDMTDRQIALKGISFSELPEVTAVTFLVKDEYNQPASGKKVFFTLSNPSVDATLSGITDPDTGEVETTTNAQGLAIAYVNSGSTHGLVSVRAEILREKYENGLLLPPNNDDRIRTQSFGISITTGLPVQSSFSMVADTYNPRGWDILGEEVEVTVNLNDQFQNPIPDGTLINFVTDGGKVEPTCETTNGTCSVKWTSASPRPGFNLNTSAKQKSNQYHVVEGEPNPVHQIHPTNDPDSSFYFNRKPGTVSDLKCGDGSSEQDAGLLCDAYRVVDEDSDWDGGRSGVVTILAYTEGEVGFSDGGGLDSNTEANGRFDYGESFFPLGEAYLDANENGEYDISSEHNPYEKLIEFDHNGAYTPLVEDSDDGDDSNDSKYQGGNCSDAAKLAGHCAEPVHIRQSIQLVMASDYVDVRLESATGEVSGDLDLTECINVYNEKSVEFKFSVADYNGNTPIKGTDLTFEIADFSIVQAPDVVANTNDTHPHSAYLKVEPGDVFSSSIARLVAAHPDEGIAGFAETPLLSDDPRIKIDTTDYLMNASAGSQIVALQFEDGCGLRPQDSDVIIIEATGVKIGTFNSNVIIDPDPVTNVKSAMNPPASPGTPGTPATSNPRADYFQIYGRELREGGELFLEIERAVNLSTVIDAEAKTQAAVAARDAAQIPYDTSKTTYDNRVAAYTAAEEDVSEKTVDRDAKQADRDAKQTDRDARASELAALQAASPQDATAIAAAEDALNDAETALNDAETALNNAVSGLATADSNKQTAETQLATNKTAFDEAANEAETAISEEEDIRAAYALTDGSIKVRAINRAAGGIETNKTFEVRL